MKQQRSEFNYIIETVNLRHENGIYALIQLKDGRIASGGYDQLIKIWTLSSFENIQIMKGHLSWICILFQLKNDLLISGGFNEIKLWNITVFQCLLNIHHNIGNPSVIIQLRNESIVYGGKQFSIKLWNSSLSKLNNISYINGVNALIELHDNRLAYSCNDAIIRLWDTSLLLNTNMKTLIGHKGGVGSLLQLRDLRLVSIGKDDYNMNIWNVNTMECLIIIKVFIYQTGRVIQLDDDNIVTCGDYGCIKIFAIDTKEQLITFKSSNVNNGSIVQFNDGRLAIFANSLNSCFIRNGDSIDIISIYKTPIDILK